MSINLEHMRHSLAHLLAAAVAELYPDALRTIGPATDNGFYYDFDFAEPISENDLAAIEQKMRKILPSWQHFERKEVGADEARALFAGNPYKLELIEEITAKGEPITLYTSGAFTDLCRGGHVEDARDIPADAFALSHLAGAYWRGSEQNKMLTRIYGLAFGSKEELDAYRVTQEEAKKRDHRKLGKELGLFTVIDEIGPGLPLFYPKGAILRRLVENYIIEEQEKRGYVPIWIPHITKGELYALSGHLDKYDAMYPPMTLDKESDYYLKPMNCPHFMMLYRTEQHSYRHLPLRYTSTTTNYRYEKSGELSGLTRVRALTQDDCHVFCSPDQIEGEIALMLDMIGEAYKTFGFTEFWVRISLRDSKEPEKYIGSDERWEAAENALRNVVKKTGWRSYEAEDEAAFYGPKLDFIMKDVLGREWQLSTIQLDFNLPERFDLEYVTPEGTKGRPVVIHRAILGSTERFLGILIEHYAGAFPLWLSPIQVKILPVGAAHRTYAQSTYEALRNAGIRVELDDGDETLGKKIRAAKMEKIPYMLVVGDEEVKTETATLESRARGKIGALPIQRIIDDLQAEAVAKRSI